MFWKFYHLNGGRYTYRRNVHMVKWVNKSFNNCKSNSYDDLHSNLHARRLFVFSIIDYCNS